MHRLLAFLLLLLTAISSAVVNTENWSPDFDVFYDIEREMRIPDVIPAIKTDKIGFTLCYDCGKRVLDHERADSIQQFGHPRCFRCMSKKYIEEHGIDDSAEQEKIKQMFQAKYWRGSK